MVTEIIMPKLGQTMEEGKIERWLKKEGDRVEKGEILLEITTDKATLEVESYGSGILRKMIVAEGETVPVTAVIGYIADESEELPETPGKIPAAAEEAAPHKEGPVKEEKKPEAVPSKDAGKVKASPLARKIAAEKGIDLSKVEGTGPGGRITKEDVLSGTPAEEKLAGLSPMRKAIAETVSKSKREIPHYYLTADIDMTEASKKREKLPDISHTHIIIKAVAQALLEFPQLNASWQEGGIKTFDDINIGIVVALEDGMITSVLRNADKKTIQEISSEAGRLVTKSRERKLTMEEYSGATFSISNLGMFGIESFIPIITPPQACMLGIGGIKEKCVAINGKMEIRPVMKVTLSSDHRVVDGVATAQFMKKLTDILENPDFL